MLDGLVFLCTVQVTALTVRKSNHMAFLSAAVIACVLISGPAFPADDSAESSILAPLAEQSLLLDIARAGDRIVAVGDRGHVLISVDDGASWKQVQVPTRAMLTAVSFFDKNFGFAVGHDGVILRTDDGGQNWQRVHYAPDEERPLFDLLIVGRKHIVAVGAYGYYLESNDGGQNWSPRDLRPISKDRDEAAINKSEAEDPPDDFHLNAIVAAGPQRWYMAGEAGALYRSNDSGQTWLRLPSPYEGSFSGLLSLTTDTLVVYGLQGRVYRSEDGGSDWQRVDTGTRAILTNGQRLTDGRLVLVGLSGAILVGNNLATRFTLHQQKDRRGVASVLSTNDGLLLVGEGGVRHVPLAALKGGK